MIDLWPVQALLTEALAGEYPVYDAVPQGAAFPYLTLGAVTGEPDEELSEAGVDGSFVVDAWSRAGGKREVFEMLEFVRASLAGPLGGGVWLCVEEFVEVMEDVSSTAVKRLYHGVARYRIRANTEVGS